MGTRGLVAQDRLRPHEDLQGIRTKYRSRESDRPEQGCGLACSSGPGSEHSKVRGAAVAAGSGELDDPHLP